MEILFINRNVEIISNNYYVNGIDMMKAPNESLKSSCVTIRINFVTIVEIFKHPY